MTSSNDTQPRTRDKRRDDTRRGLVWLMLAAIAAFPFPWWW